MLLKGFLYTIIYIFIFRLPLPMGHILLFQARPCISKSKAIASEHLSVALLLLQLLGAFAVGYGCLQPWKKG